MSNGTEPWESSVEEPTRSRRLAQEQVQRVETTAFPPEQLGGVLKPCYHVEKEQDTTPRPPLTSFEQELRKLINKHSMENVSNTPDNILAEYLSACLNAFNVATRQREAWYGRRCF